MHCRCNLVFCYVCGGVLKWVAAKQHSAGLKACTCGRTREAELAAHQGAPNHNLMPQGRQGGPRAARNMAQVVRGVLPVHAGLAAMANGFVGFPFLLGGGGDGDADGDDDDDDDW